MIYEHDYDYLAKFYRHETKVMMERGFSNYMVTSFYKVGLEANRMLSKPYDFSELETLMCTYLKTERGEGKDDTTIK